MDESRFFSGQQRMEEKEFQALSHLEVVYFINKQRRDKWSQPGTAMVTAHSSSRSKQKVTLITIQTQTLIPL